MNRFIWTIVGVPALGLLVGCSLDRAQDPETASVSQATQVDSAAMKMSENTPADQEGNSTPGKPSAADADVLFVRAVQEESGRWTFHVTVNHPDRGWEDYADGWDVVTPSGEVLKVAEGDPFTRLLLHPHVDEQPFTRSQRGLIVPEDAGKLTVRAHDIVDGFGGKEVVVDLAFEAGNFFEVERR